jgi:hypothetical protein
MHKADHRCGCQASPWRVNASSSNLVTMQHARQRCQHANPASVLLASRCYLHRYRASDTRAISTRDLGLQRLGGCALGCDGLSRLQCLCLSMVTPAPRGGRLVHLHAGGAFASCACRLARRGSAHPLGRALAWSRMLLARCCTLHIWSQHRRGDVDRFATIEAAGLASRLVRHAARSTLRAAHLALKLAQLQNPNRALRAFGFGAKGQARARLGVWALF